MGVEGVGAFAAHGFIDEEADALAEIGGAMFGDELQDGVQEFRIVGVGHGGDWCWMRLRHPNRKPAWPALDQFSPRAGQVCRGESSGRARVLSKCPRVLEKCPGMGRKRRSAYQKQEKRGRQKVPTEKAVGTADFADDTDKASGWPRIGLCLMAGGKLGG